MREPILWRFFRYAKRTPVGGGRELEVAELVQYGRQPTHVMIYHPVGFKVVQEPNYRLRSHVRSEDVLPLLLDDVEPDNSWIVIGHFPRDDRRWLYFEWTELEPTSDVFYERLEKGWDDIDRLEKTWPATRDRWLRRTVRRGGSVVRPVGPGGYKDARIRADRGGRPLIASQVETILSIADEENPGASIRGY